MRNRERIEMRFYDDYGDDYEMPTPCDCGEWFDLNDGRCSKTKDITICRACYEIEKEIEDFQNEIDDLEIAIANGEDRRQNKKQLKLIKVRLKEKEKELTNRRF